MLIYAANFIFERKGAIFNSRRKGRSCPRFKTFNFLYLFRLFFFFCFIVHDFISEVFITSVFSFNSNYCRIIFTQSCGPVTTVLIRLLLQLNKTGGRRSNTIKCLRNIRQYGVPCTKIETSLLHSRVVKLGVAIIPMGFLEIILLDSKKIFRYNNIF